MTAGGKGGVLDAAEPTPPPWGRRLIARVDRILAALDTLHREHEQTRRAVKALLEARVSGGGSTEDGGEGGEDAEGAPKRKGQPEWLTCTDPSQAEGLLLGVAQWMDTFGAPLGVYTTPCWAWHPAVVVLLLAAAEQHASAYKGKAPKDVTDVLVRVLPMVSAQVRKVLDGSECNAHAHYEGEDDRDRKQYTAHLDQLPDLAAWWATNRAGLAPGLTVRSIAAA